MIIGTSLNWITNASGACGNSGESARNRVELELDKETENALRHFVVPVMKVLTNISELI